MIWSSQPLHLRKEGNGGPTAAGSEVLRKKNLAIRAIFRANCAPSGVIYPNTQHQPS